jgi:SAM-dependent methyltransferase
VPRDLYEHPPGLADRRRAGLSRRALFMLRPAREPPPVVDHEHANERVRRARERGGHDPLLRLLEPVAGVVAGLADVGPGARVLDVGAGDGNVALACAGRGAEVAACDPAPAMVERGRRRCGRDVDWTVAGAEALPYPDFEFDVVLSSFGAALAPRPEVAASELVRVARPGGVVILTAWTPRGLPGGLDRLAAEIEPPRGVPAPSEWGMQTAARERLGSLLDGLELRTRTVRLGFGDADAAFETLARTLPLDPARHIELRPGFDALLRSTNDGFDAVEIPARYLIARGTRPPSR